MTEPRMKIHDLKAIICLQRNQKAGEERRTKSSPSVSAVQLCRQEAPGVPVMLTGIVLTCVRASWCWESNAECEREIERERESGRSV